MRIVPLTAPAALPGKTESADTPQTLETQISEDDVLPSILPEDSVSAVTRVADEGQADRRHDGQKRSVSGPEPVLPGSLESALQELADANGPDEDALIGRDVSGRVESVNARSGSQRSSQPSSARRMLMGILIAVGSFFAGYLVAGLNRPGDVSMDVVSPNGPPDGIRNAAPVEPSDPATKSMTGRVQYVDEAGAVKSDSGAFLLLVPEVNASGLQLDATSLRAPGPSLAKSAIAAALASLDASTTRADQNGEFRLSRTDAGPMKLVVISRHASRPESESVDPIAAKVLSDWFNSPMQLAGRLQVQVKTIAANDVSDDVPLEIVFGQKPQSSINLPAK